MSYYRSSSICQSNLAYNELSCIDHPENQCGVICIARHYCKRKFCSTCQYEHQIDLQQMIPFDYFPKQLQNKISQLNYDDEALFKQVKDKYKTILCQLEKEKDFQSVLDIIKERFDTVFDLIEKTTQIYIFQLKQVEGLRFCSNSELQFLACSLGSTILEDWIKAKDDSLNKIITIIKELEYQLHLQYNKEKIAQILILVYDQEILLEQTINKNDFIIRPTWEEKKIICRVSEFIQNPWFSKIIDKKQISILIEQTMERLFKYIKDGEILRLEQILDSQNNEIIRNMEQIKYLRWEGKYNYCKYDKWYATWKGQVMDVGGYYNQFGIKNGDWKELFENYWDNSNVIYHGEYKNGIKIGQWKTIYKVDENTDYKKIGGGQYDQNGWKNGEWVDIYQHFYKNCQVLLVGEYKNGSRIGEWKIIQKDIVIGGGYYDQNGSQQGQWIELDKRFYDLCQIKLRGCYQNWKKIGKWDIILRDQIIGGGFYNEKGRKDGKWRELSENFGNDCLTTFDGLYKDGIKIDKWNIMQADKIIQNCNFQINGGGYYDDKGNKTGQWFDMHKAFKNNYNIMQYGKYKNGKKVEQWDIINQFTKIGGGTYNKQGKKINNWIELHSNYGENCMVVYCGEYNEGIKIGMWKILYKNVEIGGGNYDENGMKDGIWKDLHSDFNDKNKEKLKFYLKEYQNGQRVNDIKELPWVNITI